MYGNNRDKAGKRVKKGGHLNKMNQNFSLNSQVNARKMT
jgi:hypothetical protein